MSATTTQIVILGSSLNSVMLTLNLVFWYQITSGPKAISGISAWPGASTAENTALQSGAILEEVTSFSFPVGVSVASIEAFLQQYWSNRNAQINGIGPGLYQNYGFVNGAWTASAS